MEESGCTEALCTMLRQGDSEQKSAAASVLAVLASDDGCRDTICRGGTVDFLVPPRSTPPAPPC